MQKTKKIIAFLLMIILITSTIITVNTFSYAANTTIDALRQKYPQDSTWNGSFEFATECAGFARLMFYEYYGFSPNKLEKSYDLNSLKPGDILRYDGNGTGSSTASVINVTGHKDEILCRWMAEQVAARENAVTVCCGGFHMDHITKEQIREVKEAVEEIIKTP